MRKVCWAMGMGCVARTVMAMTYIPAALIQIFGGPLRCLPGEGYAAVVCQWMVVWIVQDMTDERCIAAVFQA